VRLVDRAAGGNLRQPQQLTGQSPGLDRKLRRPSSHWIVVGIRGGGPECFAKRSMTIRASEVQNSPTGS